LKVEVVEALGEGQANVGKIHRDEDGGSDESQVDSVWAKVRRRQQSLLFGEGLTTPTNEPEGDNMMDDELFEVGAGLLKAVW
jgi:hypothetical protein